MEGEERRSETPWEEMIIGLVVLMVLLKIFSSLPSFISENVGGDGSFISQVFGITPSLDANTPIGTAILNEREAALHSEPGSEEILEVESRGAKGKTIGGPILKDGKLWWRVLYESGSVGWVRQDDLTIDVERDRFLLKESTPHGTKVENTKSTNIYSTSRENGLVVGIASPGDKGVIIGGPVVRNDGRWWQVRYLNGTSGWIPENSLQVDAEKNSKGINDYVPLGTKIVTSDQTNVYTTPRFGTVVGTQLTDARGILRDGSVTAGTIRWWDVDFDIDPDGWVHEEDLERRFPLSEKTSSALAFFKRLSYTISIILLVAVIYVFSRLRRINSIEYEKYKPLSVIPREHEVKNNRWNRVLEHLDSDNPSDWRLAILEADILLDDIVESMYLPGDTLGERLKSVDRNDFETIDQAWEAHNVRNKLAHEGGDYILTQREAKRVVNLYEQVFNEFHFI